MSLLKRTTSNLGWIMISDIAVKGSAVITTIYLARILGVVEFGIFSLGIALATTIWPIVDFGATSYGTREIAHDRARAKLIISSLNSLRLVGSILVLLVALFIFYVIDIEKIKQWALMGALLYLLSFSICPDWVARGLEKMYYLVAINLVTASLFVVLTVLLVRSPEQVIEASFIRSLSFAAGSIAGLLLLSKIDNVVFRLMFNVKHWFSLMKVTYVFLFNRIVTNLGQFAPFYVITIFFSEELTGIFASSHRLYIIVLTGLYALTSAVYPILSDLARNKPDLLPDYQQRLVHFMLFLFVPISVFCLLFSSEVMDYIFGKKYIDASFSTAVLMLALPVVAVKSIYTLSLLGGNFEKIAFKVNVIGLIFQITIAFFLVPKYGINGAAVMMLFGEMLAMSMAYIYCKELQRSKKIIDKKVLSILSISLLIGIAIYFNNISFVLAIFVGVPIYFLLSLIMGVMPGSFLKR